MSAGNQLKVEKAISAENTFTDPLELGKDEAASVSVLYGTLANTSIQVQRQLPGQTTWQIVKDQVGNANIVADQEGSYVADERCSIRIGVPTGSFGSGAGTVRLGKG